MADPTPKGFRSRKIDLGNNYFLTVSLQINGLGPPWALGPWARALGPGPGPKHLGDIDNFITKQEPKDYTLREILNMKIS